MIPRIAKQGYTAIQLMAVMEHAYYASFGYQVTSFHAASSHFGTPDDLRNLIDTAHGAGLSVLIDVVHSHASKNVLDGLNCFDGTEYQYFHSGSRGTHPMWDSRLFDYGKTEVLRFLLSNLRMWVEDYKIDGFRFDGVTSMLYHHHGTFVGFSGHYDEYFQGGAVDGDALVYLQLANEMLHTLWCKNDNQENFKSTIDNLGLEYKLSQAKGLFDRPTSNTNGIHFNSKQIVEVGEKIGEPNFFGIKCDEKNAIHFNQNSESRSLEKAREEGSFQRRRILTIAEDVSGMPLLCRPTNTEGGIGFDMRLGMGVPDMWIRLMKIPDEQWILGSILHTLCDRRPGEATISYAESHDQALVGDKTLAHWLIDGDIYTEMSLDRPANIRVDRGIALHKLVRLMSIFLGGEHYLCFEGNEFGHPEWLDFPREGNNWSFHHARRQFSLGDNPNLRYSHLAAFDSEMLYARSLMTSMCGFIQPNITYLSEDEKIFIAEYGASYLLLINLHPTSSRPNLEFSVPKGGKYLVVLDSDAMKFGGHARVDSKMTYHTIHDSKTNRDNLHIYLPSRTGIVLERSSHSAE